jgi:hypothetical protein
MANELQRLPNPDNVPSAVTTGYQRQNTNMFAIQTGLDTTEPYDNGSGTITIPAGGIIEANGVMFKIASNITVAKTVSTRAYWVEIIDNGNGTASVGLVERPGVWNPAKQGCYRTNNRRTLNWVSLGDISSPPASGQEYSSPATKGDYRVNVSTGWKYATLASGNGAASPTNNGGDGSDGGGSGSNNIGGAGGGGGTSTTPKTITTVFFNNNRNPIRIHIGAHGTKGGKGGKGGDGATGGGAGGGGGGGAGAGEATRIEGIISTGDSYKGFPGRGGKGYSTNNGIGGNGGMAGQSGNNGMTGGGSSTSGNFGGTGGRGGDRESDGENGIGGTGNATNGGGGGGGGGGMDGTAMPNGSGGGYCRIYRIEN